TLLNGSASFHELANEACPLGCQSWVNTTLSSRPIRRLTRGTMALAPGTASAPPSQKSFCMSITINASFGIPMFSPQSDGMSPRPRFGLEGGDPVPERAGLDGGAQAAHDVLVVMHVVPRQKHGTKNLLAADQVVQIGAAMVAACGTGTVFVDRSRV